MNQTRSISVAAGITLALVGCAPKVATRLEGRIVDDASGKPLVARVAITNAVGQFVEIEGRHPHVEYLGKRWCYVEGQFSATAPGTGAGIEIRRGLETRPVFVALGAGTGKTIQKEFRLRRWIDMRKEGYVSGDFHAHLPVPEEAHFQMQAEDLNALNLLYLPARSDPIPVNACFTGKPDTHSTDGCEIYVGHGIQEWQMGHLNLLGLKKLVPDYPEFGGSMEYWQTNPHWDLGRAMRAARDQQGMVAWAHVCSLPGAQLPVGLGLGLVDAIELLTWNDPLQFPNHWSPWLNSGMPRAEFPIMSAVDLYYQFLNAGFRLPIAAGTDKMFEEIPLGSNRTYARVGDQGGHDAWLGAIKSGKCFVSNGPILEFDVDGHEPGDVIEFNGSKRIQARVRARSILPFTTIEIVLNGEAVGHKTVAIPNNPPVDGLYTMEVEASIELTRSGWFAARVVDHPDLKNRILPRDVPVFAHTSPIYFLREGQKVREAASIAYLSKWVQGTLHWLDSKPGFFNPEDLRNARRDAEQALRYYQQL